jgi:CHAD domain-containing protein
MTTRGSTQRGARAPATVHARAAEVIEEQRDRIADNLGSAVDGRDPDGVHDMRVASRRLRAALQVFAPWLDDGEVDRIAPDIRSITRALGPVRELDVMRLALAAWTRRAVPLRALAIEAVDSRLAAQRRRARARMMKRFAKVDLEALDELLRRLVAELRETGRPESAPAATGDGAAGTDEAPSGAEMVDLMRAVASDAITSGHRISHAELPQELGSARAREALHEVRIEAKKLRYVLEIIAPELGPTGKKLVRRLRKLQDRLGTFHDDVVLDEAVGGAAVRAAAKQRSRLAAELNRLRSSRRRALLADERACRREIDLLRSEGFARAIAEALIAVDAITRADLPELPAPRDDSGGVSRDGDGADSSRPSASDGAGTETGAPDDATKAAAKSGATRAPHVTEGIG